MQRWLQLSKYGVFSFVFPLVVYILSLQKYAGGGGFNVIATQFSMWKYHSFSIGAQGHPLEIVIGGNSPDTFLFDGKYFSDYSPGQSLVSFPFAIVGFILDGGVLKPSGFAVLSDELFLAVCAGAASFLVYRISLWYSGRLESLLAGLTLALGTAVWPFAATTYDHTATLVFSLLSTYLVMRHSRNAESDWNLVFAGLALGVSALIDYVSMLLAFPLLAYLLVKNRESDHRAWVKRLSTFIGPFLAVAGVNLVYNYVNFGSAITFPEQFFKGAPKSSLAGLLSRFSLASLASHVVFNLISPYRGLLLLSPVLILGMYGLYKMVTLNEYRLDSVLFISLFVMNLLPYSAWDDWDGGWSYGPRFLIYGLPYLVIPIGFVLWKNRSRLARILFAGLFSISSVLQGAGAFVGAAQPSSSNMLLYQPFAQAFPELQQSSLGVWWSVNSHPRLCILIVILVFAVILVSVWYLTFLRTTSANADGTMTYRTTHATV